MAKIALRIAEVIQSRLSAPVQFVIAVALLSVSGFSPIDIDLPIFLGAALTLAGIGLLGTSMMPPVMSLFDASEWEELSGTEQMIVLSVVSVAIFGLTSLTFVL